MRSLLGLSSPEAVVGMTPADMPWTEEFRRVVAALDKEVVENGREFINVPREDPEFGKPTPTLSTVVPLRRSDGTIDGVISVLVDVAELRKAQEGLQQAEQRLVLAMESSGAGVWDIDVASNHVYRSPSALAMLGYAEDGMSSLMEDMPTYIHPDDQLREAKMRARVVAGESDLIEMEHRVRCGDGNYRWVLSRGAVLHRDENGMPMRIVGTFTNIHDAYLDRTRAAEQRKLESIGQLAAGVAHEINTPLQFVGDSVEFLRSEFESLLGATANSGDAAAAAMRADVPKAFAMLQDGITRIAEIVRAMRDFSHPGSIAKEPADVGDLLDMALALSRHEYKNVADVHTDFAVLPPLPCHPGELSQVFVNLVVNAAQAIAELDPLGLNRGLITVRTRLVDRTVVVEIEDTGSGIPEAIIDRVFDPFFTTKPMGHGTGQGLAIARNIVEQHHGGRILVDSHEGRGTVMQILLPLEEAMDRAVA
jgi:PAS domain S-box-containing protein